MEKGRFIFKPPKGNENEVSLTILPKGHKLELFEHVVAYQLAKSNPPTIKIRPPKDSNEPTISITPDSLRKIQSLEDMDRLSFIHHLAKLINNSFAVTFIHSIEDLHPNPTTPFEKFINTLSELDKF